MVARNPGTVYVLIKQVPNMKSKAGMNADGTIDRASAKAMLNPFDAYAVRAALDIKKATGWKVVGITMGPPRAEEVLVEIMEHGVDECVLLTDRRLAGSDTLATAYALSKTIQTLGVPDVVLCGLQTTDGDTAQVGPQIAERLDVPQISYVEDFHLSDNNTRVQARRVVEGGCQNVEATLPALMTIANAYKPLGQRVFKDVARVKHILKSPEEKAKSIQLIDLDKVGADFTRTGLDGSPTIVSATEKLKERGASTCEVFHGKSAAELTEAFVAGVARDPARQAVVAGLWKAAGAAAGA